MPIDLEALRAGQVTKSVTVRGVSMELRLVTSAEVSAIRKAYPLPQVAMVMDASKAQHNGGGFVVNREDPAQIEAEKERGFSMLAAKVAVSLGEAPAADAAALRAAVVRLREVLSEGEIGRLIMAIESLEEAQAAPGAALKN